MGIQNSEKFYRTKEFFYWYQGLIPEMKRTFISPIKCFNYNNKIFIEYFPCTRHIFYLILMA
jgi:hypothetical protein